MHDIKLPHGCEDVPIPHNSIFDRKPSFFWNSPMGKWFSIVMRSAALCRQLCYDRELRSFLWNWMFLLGQVRAVCEIAWLARRPAPIIAHLGGANGSAMSTGSGGGFYSRPKIACCHDLHPDLCRCHKRRNLNGGRNGCGPPQNAPEQVKCSSSENSCSETPPASNANPSAAAQLCIWQHEMGKRRNASEKAIDPIDPVL